MGWLLGLLCVAGCGRTGLFGDRDGWGAEDGWGDERGDREDEDEAFEPGEQTCREVDFLFVIDNSRSMEDNQAKLLLEYDSFVTGFTDAVDRLESVHVGVVTTDVYAPNASQCRELGGLVVETGGTASSNTACGPYPGGANYMSGVEDIAESFACAARVGIQGSNDEQPMGAAIGAVSPPLTGDGACNDGFIRPGALLVVVLVTDEDIELDPLVSFVTLSEAKAGDDRNIVFVALANDPDAECKYDEGRKAHNLAELVSYFSYGFIAPICAPDYAEIFAEAVEVATAACEPG